MRRLFCFPLFAALVLQLFAVTVAATQEPSRLELHIGQRTDGSATGEWLHAVRHYNDADAIEQLSLKRTPFTAKETEWRDLISSNLDSWTEQTPSLQEPFKDISPPAVVRILLGNLGGSDAFLATETVIAFDLRRMQEVYGSAAMEVNLDRVDRFFAHEYTHVMHRAWQAARNPELNSPLERALWVSLKEGVGNYRSLSTRWLNADGSLSAHAESTIARLSPIFVSRLAALATATEAEAPDLMDGLSMGPFEDKWGALPVALWLAVEMAQNNKALGEWVERGPWGVIELAGRHLPESLARQLPAMQQ